jgi:hypothetical protein
MDNRVPELQEYGRESLQSAVNELDQLMISQSEFLGKQRDRLQGQIDNVIETGRQEDRDVATIAGILDERGSRSGITSQLSVTEKQVLATYLGGSSFAQKVGAEGLIPSLSIPFDPSEQISVGDATALVQAAKRSRRMVLADQLGDINGQAIGSGFSLADEDGKLTVNEVMSPPLGEDIQRLRYNTPPGQPLSIKPGLPNVDTTREAVSNFFERGEAAIGEVPVVGKPISNSIEGVRNVSDFFKRQGAKQDEIFNRARETN